MAEKARSIDLSKLLFFYRGMVSEVSRDMAEYERIAKLPPYNEQEYDLNNQKKIMTDKYGDTIGTFLDKHLKVIQKELLGEEIDNSQLKNLCSDDYMDFTRHILENRIELDNFKKTRLNYDEIMLTSYELLKLSEDEIYKEIESFQLGNALKDYKDLISEAEKEQYQEMYDSVAESDLTSTVAILKHMEDQLTNQYYNQLIDEYINHLKTTPYPADIRKQNLAIAYQAKADLLGEKVNEQMGSDKLIHRAQNPSNDALTDNHSEISKLSKRNQAFEQAIINGKEKLSQKLNHKGLTILGKLLTSIRQSFSKKHSLISVRMFSSETYGKALTDIVDKKKSKKSEDNSPKPK
jgi:hypothetical protein